MPIDPQPAILIVDDSDDDYDATVRALRKSPDLKNPLRRCESGREALDYLYRRGRYAPPADAPRPAIVLLDLNMPGMDGREVLSIVKNDANLRLIPVIVLTNSDDKRDIAACYHVGANSYIQKPSHWSGFVDAIRCLKAYWFDTAALPGA